MADAAPFFAGTLFNQLDKPSTLLDQLVLYSELEYFSSSPSRRQLAYQDGKIGNVGRPKKGILSDYLPWRPGDQLEVMARGGLYNLERRRVMVAAESYASTVMRNRKSEILGNYHTSVGPSTSVNVGPIPDELVAEDQRESLPATTGLDRLTVHGNANIRLVERKAMMTGTVNRVWTGAITRMASMEGILCAGGFARAHAGSSATLAPIISGDVYGQGIHVAASRIHMATLGYRSADTAQWSMGLYTRATQFTIVPILGTPSKTKPPSTILAKLFRLARGLLPFLDIGVGLAMLLPSIAAMIYGFIVRKPKPPTGPPRQFSRISGVSKISANSVLIT